jgi:phospholipid/cholesterol/gamma-HCH transport system substrate-binding protein
MRLLPERSFRDMNPYIVGLVSVGVLGAIVGFAFLVGLLHLFEKTYALDAVFPDAAGLRGGDDVKVAGVKAGRVTSLEVDRHDGTVIVHMAISKGVELGHETHAEIALATLLGSKYVRLSGDVDAPYLESMARDERTIPIDRTKTPFDVFELTRIGTKSIQGTDTEKLNELVHQLADVTDGRHDAIAKIATGVDRVGSAVNARSTQRESLLDQAAVLTTTLKEKDGTLVALIEQSRGILSLLSQRRADVSAAVNAGGRVSTELARLLTDNDARLQSILDELAPTVDLVDKRQADLNAALAYLGPAQVLQSRAGSHGPWADVFVRALGPDVVAVLEDALNGDEQP